MCAALPDTPPNNGGHPANASALSANTSVPFVPATSIGPGGVIFTNESSYDDSLFYALFEASGNGSGANSNHTVDPQSLFETIWTPHHIAVGLAVVMFPIVCVKNITFFTTFNSIGEIWKGRE